MAADEELKRFIGSSFSSVWALEVLLHLKSAGRPQSASKLIASLRASELVIQRSVEELVAAGLALSDQSGEIFYQPVSPAVAEQVEQTEALYRGRPDMVRRLIIARSPGSLATFANAFRLRKDD